VFSFDDALAQRFHLPPKYARSDAKIV